MSFLHHILGRHSGSVGNWQTKKTPQWVTFTFFWFSQNFFQTERNLSGDHFASFCRMASHLPSISRCTTLKTRKCCFQQMLEINSIPLVSFSSDFSRTSWKKSIDTYELKQRSKLTLQCKNLLICVLYTFSRSLRCSLSICTENYLSKFNCRK